MKVQITKERPRLLAGVALVALAAVFCILYPGILNPDAAGVFPLVFLVCALAAVLLDFSTKYTPIKIVCKTLALLGCLLALLTISELLIGQHIEDLLIQNPGAFFYGCSIIAALGLFFYALCGSVPWALRITTLLVTLFSAVTYFTLAFRGTPFIPQDFFGLGTAADVASSYSLFFSENLALALLICIGVFYVATRIKIAKLPKLHTWVVRAGSLVLSIVFFVVTVSKPFIVATDLEPFYFEQRQSMIANGSVVNFVANIADASREEPEGYSLEAVNAIAAEYTSDSASSATEKPDVVVILGESWADIVPEGLAKTSESVTPFISNYAHREDTNYGSLIVSSKGGGTSRQEFQFLTGANDEYGLHTAPFLFLVDEQLPSIVDSFNQLDYNTIALHNGTPTAWNRDTAFPALGFDRFISEDELAEENSPYLRTYLRDSVMYDEALEILDEAEDPTFLYAITIQTHGGYGHEDFESTIHIEKPEGSYDQTEQYLSLLNEADKDLETFITALEERERPTLVLFFGDHLPNFDNSYEADVLEDSDPLWRYKTLYGVWANYELPRSALSEAPSLSLSYLNAYLMQAAGLPMTGYQKFLLEGAEEYPVSSLMGFVDSSGTLMSVEDAAETDIYQEQAIMQYNFVYDRENMPKEFFFLSP